MGNVRFDEGGIDGTLNFVYLVKQIKRKREPSGATLRCNLAALPRFGIFE